MRALWIVAVTAGFVVLLLQQWFLAAGFFLSLSVMLAIRPALERRRAEKLRPPKGTRPDVQVVVNGITYDVTENLVRVPDQNGLAVWVILGPQHVEIHENPVVKIRHPVPLMTEVDFHLLRTGPKAARFTTLDEIRREYRIQP